MDSMTTNLLDGCRSCCHNEIVFPKDQVVHLCSFFEEHHETKFCEFQNLEIFYSQPAYDEYENGEEKNFILPSIDLSNNQPLFDNFESKILEGSERGSVELIYITTTKNGEEHNFTSTFIDLCNNEPVFDEYESDIGEIDEGNQPIQDFVVHCHKTNDVRALIST